jgi:acyl dehydratase
MAEPRTPLDPSIAGARTAAHEHRYGWRELCTYALGVGATRAELSYLYEGAAGGMQVLPTYAVVPAYPVVIELLERAGAEAEQLVHVAQTVRAHRAAPPRGVLETVGTLAGVYDVKRYAQLVIETTTTAAGEPLFDTVWTIVVRGRGGFDGPRPPRGARAPRIEAGREPDWSVEQATLPEQALLYRLSGDPNPLHADDRVAQAAGFDRGAILHGLCTFGFVGRAVVREAAGGDAARLRSLTATFRRPVWPGETIHTAGIVLSDGRVALRVSVAGRDEPVLGDAWAEVGEPLREWSDRARSG